MMVDTFSEFFFIIIMNKYSCRVWSLMMSLFIILLLISVQPTSDYTINSIKYLMKEGVEAEGGGKWVRGYL